MIIYFCQNITNKKFYIGLTKQPFHKRIKQHEKAILNPKTAFHNAIAKYGIENFHWSVLDNTAKTIDELKQLEIFYINLFRNRFGDCYNMTDGGDGVLDSYGLIAKKISISTKGRISPMKGKSHTKEAIEANRLAHLNKPGFWKGKKRPDISKNQIGKSGHNKGKKMKPKSEETKLKISLSLTGRKFPNRKYKHHSEDTKQKMRLAWIKRKENVYCS